MAGGLGDDIYFVDDAGDAVAELGGQGSDEIRTALAAYSLAALANVENLTGLGRCRPEPDRQRSRQRDQGGWGADRDRRRRRRRRRWRAGASATTSISSTMRGDTITEGEEQGLDEVRTNLASFSIAGFANVEKLTGGAADQSADRQRLEQSDRRRRGRRHDGGRRRPRRLYRRQSRRRGDRARRRRHRRDPHRSRQQGAARARASMSFPTSSRT